MITKVTVRNFKRFRETTEFVVKPDGVTFLAGGNNSGKSTLLQALAVWEFARTVIQINKGKVGLQDGPTYDGIGVSAEEFSPVALPDLKHLWSNLRVYSGQAGGGYMMRIRCDWMPAAARVERHLEVALNLSNERIFIKRTASNLDSGDDTPRMAYLPPFAGIGRREERMSEAARKRWIGRGLAGAVLRNLIYDAWNNNRSKRQAAKNPRGNIPAKALAEIRKTDAWEQLLKVLEEVFKTGLSVSEFNELYHTALEVSVWDGNLVRKHFQKKGGTAQKDLMSEGSGFLQWLSVYALALNRDLDVLLLDEPDAHLHPALQGHLIQKLTQLARENEKQVFLATHSTTILGNTNVERIFRMEDRAYLSNQAGRVALFQGLGSIFCPLLDSIKQTKRLLLHEGISDIALLKIWAGTLGIPWPENVVLHQMTGKKRADRELIFEIYRKEIPGLKCLSLQDADGYDFGQTKSDLTFDNLTPFKTNLGLRMWRRRNIENYVLSKRPIVDACGKPEGDVDAAFNSNGVPLTPFPTGSDVGGIRTWALIDGKFITSKPENPNNLTTKLGCDIYAIAKKMTANEIAEDVKTFLNQLVTFAQ